MSVVTIALIAVGIVLGLAFGSQLIFVLQRVVIALTQIALFVGLLVGLGWLWSTSQKSAVPRGPVETPAPAWGEAAPPTLPKQPDEKELPIPELPKPSWWMQQDEKYEPTKQ